MHKFVHPFAGAVCLASLLMAVESWAAGSDERWEMLLHTASGTDVYVISEIDSVTFRSTGVPAVCCVGGDCWLMTEGDCIQADGVFHPEWAVCNPNPCLPLEAACCLPNGDCLVVTEDYCDSVDGEWHAGWAGCDPNPCSANMIWIPAGYVRLGQAGIAVPVHDVWVDGFWIGKYEVKNAEFRQFIDAGGYEAEAYWHPVGWAWRVANAITHPHSWFSHAFNGGGIPGNEGFPANGVSWWEADAYCRWAGKRLPTEAEWEKAAKGGCEMWGDPAQCDDSDTPTYPWGAGISGPRANYRNSGDPYDNSTTPVGYYDGGNHGGYQTIDSPSPYGLYDVAGNVYEWTSSMWAGYPYDPDDGREEPPSAFDECCRVVRGGSWNSSTAYLRSAARYDYFASGRYSIYGFRYASD